MADFGDILNNISIGAGQSVRRNAGDSAFEAFTPGSGGGMADPGSNGILARTALDTTVARTLTGTANQITVSNGDGVAGNPTLSTPQNIHTGASPTFAGLTATGTVTADNLAVSDEAYGSSWNGSSNVPTKNAVYDKIELVNVKSVGIQVTGGVDDVTTGNGKAYFTIPEMLNGFDLIRAQATVVTAGTTNATTVMVHNLTDAVDMLTGAVSIASGNTVGTVGTIDTSNDDVATNDIIRIDVPTVSTTAPQGLMVVLEFKLP
jgi:hypothetical protein